MNNSTYIKAVAVQRFLKNESASASLLKPMNGVAFSLSNSLIAERTQVYDKLAKLDEQEVDALVKEFSISHGGKKKKETLAQTICKLHTAAECCIIANKHGNQGVPTRTRMDRQIWC
jgi:hypothetical protein